MRTVFASAPTRIDLAGGTLDLPPLHVFHPGALTVNMAISLRAAVQITSADRYIVASRDQDVVAAWDTPKAISWREHPKLELILRILKSFNPDVPLRVDVDAQAPAGSGLGGSSAIAIALSAALARWYEQDFEDMSLIGRAKECETQTIKVPTGYQDYWAAVFGGIHAYEVRDEFAFVATSLGSPAFRQKLQDHLLLVFTGKPHFSGANNWELFKQHIDELQNGGTGPTVEFFERLKDNAVAMQNALEAEQLPWIANVLNLDWQTRKRMLPSMTTPEIERLTRDAFKRGAYALRVCGAGAGGCAVLLVEPEKRRELAQYIADDLHMRPLDVEIGVAGVQVAEDVPLSEPAPELL